MCKLMRSDAYVRSNNLSFCRCANIKLSFKHLIYPYDKSASKGGRKVMSFSFSIYYNE